MFLACLFKHSKLFPVTSPLLGLHALSVRDSIVPRPPYLTPDSQASGGEAVVQNMEQALTALREELEEKVQELSKSRNIEDRAARMAKEADVSKVRATEMKMRKPGLR